MPRILGALVCCAVLALAGCTSSASSPAASASSAATITEPTPSDTPGPSATASPGATASPNPTPTASPTAAPTESPTESPTATPRPSLAAAPCKPTTKAGTVAVKIVDFGFKPMTIKARVGQIITFRNTGFEPHTATLDTEDCTTSTIDSGKSKGLRFTAAGSFAFHCSIHSWMTGTITIRP